MPRSKRPDPDLVCNGQISHDESFIYYLPRSMDGEGLKIAGKTEEGLIITDGKRKGIYVPCQNKPLAGPLKIIRGYTEAGWFTEANVIWIGNGRRRVLYQPWRVWRRGAYRAAAPRSDIKRNAGKK